MLEIVPIVMQMCNVVKFKLKEYVLVEFLEFKNQQININI